MGPQAIITDQGVQFGEDYRTWCKRHGIEPRYGALQKSNSLALIERFFRPLKTECLRVALVALRPKAMEVEIATFLRWYHLHRPHQGLKGKAPVELWPGAEIDPRPPVRKRKRSASEWRSRSSPSREERTFPWSGSDEPLEEDQH